MEVGWYIKFIWYIGLRYSPFPLETVFVSSITKYNDSKNKYLDEYGNIPYTNNF